MLWTLIGASDIAATRMIPAMRELGHSVVGVVSSSADRARDYAAAQNIPLHTNSLDEALKWEADAVYISTTNELHYSQALAAIEQGKHILCEKPLAMNYAAATDMVAQAMSAKLVFGTNHHLRCSVTHRTMRELVTSGRLGTIHSVRINHAVSLPERLRGWRVTSREKGAGVVLDIVVHDVDTMRFILDSDLVEVTSFLSSQGSAPDHIEDTSMNIFRMSNGVLVSSYESFVVPYGKTSIEIYGSLGSVFAMNVMSQDPVGEIRLSNQDGEYLFDTGEPENLYVYGLRKFEEAVNGKGEPAASGQDGLASLAGALAVLKSAKTGHKVQMATITGGEWK